MGSHGKSLSVYPFCLVSGINHLYSMGRGSHRDPELYDLSKFKKLEIKSQSTLSVQRNPDRTRTDSLQEICLARRTSIELTALSNL